MSRSAESSNSESRSIAALFDDYERKELFRKYIFFLGWVEILILAVCWLYQVGDSGYDQTGNPVDIAFPWKAYFLIAFLTPVAITFLLGVITVGFNKYFGQSEAHPEAAPVELPEEESGRAYKFYKVVLWLQRLPFLALLMLLGIATGFFYKLDAIVALVGSVGEKSVKILLMSAAVLLGLASIFAVILIVLNFQLRKRSMEYQYKSEVAERFGLIILDDNTVINKDGKLLVQGKTWKENVPLLPVQTMEPDQPDTPASTPTDVPRPVKLETSTP